MTPNSNQLEGPPTQRTRSATRWLRPLVAVIVVLTACTPVDLSRFSDAVRRVADRGIGGTGITDDDRGIGGTGIVGTITGFGSVLVNGFKVEFDQETVITIDGVLATEETLNVGQVVAIEATTRNGALQAQSIAVANAVSGPITAIAAAGNQIEVLGQTVSLEPGSLKSPAPANLQAGQWVTVSGLRNAEGTIVASRISPRAVGGRISVRGPIAARTATGFRIGRLSVVAPTATQTVTPGRVALAVGALTSAGLRASQVEVAPSVPFDGQLSRLSIEGFVGRREGQQVSISGVQVSITDATALVGKADNQLSRNDRVTIDAVIDNGEAIAETIDASDPAARDATESRREGRRDRARARAQELDRRSAVTNRSARVGAFRSTDRNATPSGAVSTRGSDATDGQSAADRDAGDANDSDSSAADTDASNEGSGTQGAATTDATTDADSNTGAAVSASSEATSSTDSSSGAPSTGVSASSESESAASGSTNDNSNTDSEGSDDEGTEPSAEVSASAGESSESSSESEEGAETSALFPL